MVRLFPWVSVLVAWSIGSLPASPRSDGQDLGERARLISLLESPDPTVRQSAAGRILEERASQIRALVEVAGKEDGPDLDTPAKRSGSPKRIAISCLGFLRADDAESLKVLWANLTYRKNVEAGTLNEITDPGSYYPAAASLVRIGKPSCEGAWRELETTDDPVRRDLAIYILERVEGRELAQQLVEQRLQKLAGQPEILHNVTPHKRNLERARQWIIDRSKDASSGGKPPTIGDER